MNLPAEISSVAQCIEILHELEKAVGTSEKFTQGISTEAFPFGIWFRGESLHDPHLWPSIFRNHNKSVHLQEPSLSNQIQTRIPDLYTLPNEFDQLSLAQHYNIPTRLLDWSESILVALFFAANSGGNEWQSKDGILYILNAYSLNKVSAMGRGKGTIHTPKDFGTLFRAYTSFCFSEKEWADYIATHSPPFSWDRLKEEDDVFRQQYGHFDNESGKQFAYFTSPIAVVPARNKQRMIVQSSVVTIFGGSLCWKNSDCRPKPIPQIDEAGNPIYLKIPVPLKHKPKIRKDLFSLGIHKGTLFPEMDHQYEYLITLW
jgi:hypothetical protein